MTSKCNSGCGVIFDEMPTFSAAEAITFRFITFDFEIAEFLARVALFEEKLNADDALGCLIEAILMHLGLKLENFMTTQQDRPNTKK